MEGIKILIFFLLLLPLKNNCNLHKVIANFFQLKNIQLATIFSCSIKHDLLELQKDLSRKYIRTTLLDVNNFYKNYKENSTNEIFYDIFGFVLDLDCENSQEFLEMINLRLNRWHSRFSHTYKWLIFTNNNSSIFNTFTNVTLRLDSDVSLAIKLGEIYEIYDVYNSGFGEINGRLQMQKFMVFDGKGLRMLDQRSFYVRRKNLTGLCLKSTTVITKNISTLPEDYLVDRKSKDDSVNKLNYALFLHIIGIHQFKNKILTTNTWYGPSASGIDGGLTHHLWYKMADVSATSGIMTRERVLAVDFLISTYYFGTCFIFRNPSAIGKIRNQFFDPFATKTWYICLLFCILLCIFLRVTFTIHNKLNKTDLDKGSWSSSILNTLAAFCQQDIETDEQNITGRIVILCLMVLSLLLYNYYTSSIVSDLINSRTQAFSTIGELVHSNLELGMEDIAYTERLFKTSVDPDIVYLRDKKILVPGKSKNYFTPKEGIAKVKKGGFAYHVEPATGYPLIAKTFDGAEICDLCEIYVFKQSLIYVLAQKNLQYRKLFSISYRKMMERGIMRRESLIWQAQTPECLSSANVLQIELEQVAPAFFVLLFGILFSLVILAVEIKLKNKQNEK